MTHQDNFVPKQYSASDDQEDEGNLILQILVRKNAKVKLRLGGNDKTPNRDGFIELRDDKHVMGKLEVQVKPVDSERKKKQNRLCYQLDASLIGHSLVAGLPFILICYDRDTNKAYWKHITKALFAGAKPEQQSKTVDFVAEDEIGDGCSYSDNWLQLVSQHLEALKLAETMRSAIELLKSDSDKAFATQLESPQAMADLLKRIHDTAAEKYRARLETAQDLFRQAQIEAAAKILAPLAEEISKDEQTAALLFDVYIWLGNCRYRLEEFKEAEECFREALKLDKESPRLQMNLAHILYVRNTSKKEALDWAEKAYATRPDDENTISTYLMCLSFNKQLGEIEKIVRDRSTLIDGSSVIQLALGQIAKEQGNYASSCESFENALKLDPQNHHARILFAESAYKLVRVSATKSLAQGILPDQEAAGTDLDNAVAELDTAIEYFTKTTDRAALYRAYDYRAVINMIRGKFEPALADCEKMDAVIPNKEFAKIIRAQIYTQINRFDDVVNLLQPLAEGGRRDVLQALAYSYYSLKQYSDAAGCFTRYIDEDNDSDSELFAYVQCLWFSEQKKRAYQVAYKLRKASRAPFEIMREVELARLLELEDWRGALDVIEDLIKAAPTNAEPLIQRVAMHMNLRNRQEGMKLYAELPLNLIEGDSWARDSFAKLEHGLRELRWL